MGRRTTGMTPRASSRLQKRDGPPWLVPAVMKLELGFFKKLFTGLRTHAQVDEALSDDCAGIPIVDFKRALSRLFFILDDTACFDANNYDVNGDGLIGWMEFSRLWDETRPAATLTTTERIFLTLEDAQASRLGRITSIFVLTGILVSAGAFVVSTLPSMQEQTCAECEPVPFKWFFFIDIVCVIVFSFEYILRLVTASQTRTELLTFDETVSNLCTEECIQWPTTAQRAWVFVKAWPNVIDFAAIAPSYISFFVGDLSAKSGAGGGMIVLRLIRLLRIVRAIRLARRLEAVAIIARSMKKSVRAIWVLMLNLSLGMLIAGAIMYFVEQGQYNRDTGEYDRFEKWVLNDTSSRYEKVKTPSPFKSIPHAFWWALVTATTVGYGDDSPTTFEGKIAAAAAMIWSLCVLALPVGVIGSNFENTWKDYDNEKRIERELKKSESEMVRETLRRVDPLCYSREVRFEVFHNSQLSSSENDVFMGEASVELDIDRNSIDVVSEHFELPLQENRSKAARSVFGKLYVNYTWTPATAFGPGIVLEGKLDITILRAECLTSIDWHATSLPDTYVCVTLYPHSPGLDANIIAKTQGTGTIFGTAAPQWNETLSFDFCWHVDGVEAKKAANRKGTASVPSEPVSALRSPHRERRAQTAVDGAVTTWDRGSRAVRSLRKVQSDVLLLQSTMQDIKGELGQLRAGTCDILAHLSHSCSPSAGSLRGMQGGNGNFQTRVNGAMGSSNGGGDGGHGSRQTLHHQRLDPRFEFLAPGSIPEDACQEQCSAQNTPLLQTSPRPMGAP